MSVFLCYLRKLFAFLIATECQEDNLIALLVTAPSLLS